MKRKTILLLSAAAMVVLTGCSGKLGALSADNFKVTPKPMEVHAGHVQVTTNGLFPEKYMKRNAVVTVTPELRYQTANGPVVARGIPATFQGERVLGNDQTISYMLGGHYTLKSDFAYVPDMQQSELYMTFDARVGNKVVEVPAVKVADGVIATAELYRRALATGNLSLAVDSFQRITRMRQDANIKFLIQQAELRKSELQNNSVSEFVALLKRINADRESFNLNNIEVSAYASPDGGYRLNEALASRREAAAEGYVRQQMRGADLTAPVNAHYTAQDWEGFQQLVRASNIQDKEVILRVLSMYEDPEEREQQIKNMSEGFRELADGILPELRRARLSVNYEVIGRDDNQIQEQLRTDASQLSLEEMLYAATLQPTLAEQAAVYQQTARLYPADCRAVNNLAVVQYAQGHAAEALQTLERARQMDAANPDVNANLRLLALLNGDVSAAENYIGRASGASRQGEVLGTLHMAQGNYALAAQDFGYTNSNSAALAEILNNDYAKAARTLKAINNHDGLTDYLQAILNQRQGNSDAAASFLRSALQKDPSLATYAERDLELKSLVQ